MKTDDTKRIAHALAALLLFAGCGEVHVPADAGADAAGLELSDAGFETDGGAPDAGPLACTEAFDACVEWATYGPNLNGECGVCPFAGPVPRICLEHLGTLNTCDAINAAVLNDIQCDGALLCEAP